METSSLSLLLVFILSISGIRGLPSGNVSDAERANLAEAIQSAASGSSLSAPASSTLTPILINQSNTNDSSTTIATESEIHQTSGTSSINSQTTENAKVEVEVTTQPPPPASPSAPANPPVSNLVIVRPNLIAGGSGSIHGVIHEALNLAQVAIALFGQALVGQFVGNGNYVTVSNSTRIIGE